MQKNEKGLVAVAMSGGVDSSVAALLLLRQGFCVIGLTMCFGLRQTQGRRPNCCGIEGIEDARRAAGILGIRHYVLNMHKALEERVIDDFCREYQRGRTPNPCVRCNQYLKFGLLLEKALGLGADYLATGHYARIVKKGPRYQLKKAIDRRKDQSYFLYRLTQRQMRRILFPLGAYTKDRVRALAQEAQLPTAQKAASQEICFLPDQRNYRSFLQARPGFRAQPGPVKDKEGLLLGMHAGIPFYTIGQRQGLKIARGYPVYITGIDPVSNTITVGPKEEAFRTAFVVKEPHFILAPPKRAFAAQVKIRYNHREAPARIECFAQGIRVIFRRPQFAVTPGQSAVFYDRDTVLGGGVIEGVE